MGSGGVHRPWEVSDLHLSQLSSAQNVRDGLRWSTQALGSVRPTSVTTVECTECKRWAHVEYTGLGKSATYICHNCDSDADSVYIH